MEIHELNDFSGTLGANDFFATDNGDDTSKVSAEQLFAPLNERIDNIITSPAPSVEEIIDARMGATALGGKQYPTLGGALRGQATQLLNISDALKNDLNSVKNTAEFDPLFNATWESGSINTSNGGNVTDARRIRTAEYIDVSMYELINFSIDSGFKYFVFFYNENKEKIYNSPAWTTVETPFINYGNYKYLRVAVADSSDGTASLEYASHLRTSAVSNFNDLVNNTEYLMECAQTDNLVDLFDLTLWKPGESDGSSAVHKIYQDVRFACSEGDIFYIAGVSEQLMHYLTCGFFDSNGVSLGRQYAHSSIHGAFMSAIATAPRDSAYMMISISTGVSSVRVTPTSFFASDPQAYVGKRQITSADDIYKKYKVVPYSDYLDLKNTIEADSVTIPTYWEQYMEDKVETLRNLDGVVGTHGTSFVFITDVHWENNFKNAPKLIKYILEHTSVDAVICGGDILTKNNSIAAAMAVINDWGDKTNKLGTINVFGNHDNNSNAGNSESLWIGYDRWYGSLLKPIEQKVIWSDNKKYFYADNQAQKIRMIFLNTGYDQGSGLDTEQAAWLQQLLYSLESGWKAIVFTHLFFAPATVASGTTVLEVLPSGTLAKQMIDSHYANMISHGADFIGIITGHVHRDYSLVSENGYPIIGTTCDANGQQASLYDPANPTRTSGTTTEQAFDVYHIDTENRQIYVTRIGAGSDRTFSY